MQISTSRSLWVMGSFLYCSMTNWTQFRGSVCSCATFCTSGVVLPPAKPVTYHANVGRYTPWVMLRINTAAKWLCMRRNFCFDLRWFFAGEGDNCCVQWEMASGWLRCYSWREVHSSVQCLRFSSATLTLAGRIIRRVWHWENLYIIIILSWSC